MESTYKVFISYRRNGGSEKAQLIKSEIKLRGIGDEQIFLDTHSLHDGDFEHKIKVAISQSESVAVIISSGCFDEIKETDFWYMEIKEALVQEKKIIPVFFDGISSFEGLKIPEELKELKRKNAVTYQHEYAEAAFDKLADFIGSPHNKNNIPKNRGCLFSLKYKGCIISVALASLFVFVLVPVMTWKFDSKPEDSNDNGLISYNSEEVVERTPNMQYDTMVNYPANKHPKYKDVTSPPACASPAMRSEQLIGRWHGNDADATYRYIFSNHDVILEKKDSHNGKTIRKHCNYDIENERILFKVDTIRKSAKYIIRGNNLTLYFDNGETILLQKQR